MAWPNLNRKDRDSKENLARHEQVASKPLSQNHFIGQQRRRCRSRRGSGPASEPVARTNTK